MFKSIRWKFITVYFLLVFIAMIIVMAFIIQKFEDHYLNQTAITMEARVKNLANRSDSISKNNEWAPVSEEIQKDVMNQPVYVTEIIYVIDNSDLATIIATNASNAAISGQSAYNLKQINQKLVINAKKESKIQQGLSYLDETDDKIMHLAYPVLNEEGRVKGIIYITSDLKDMYNTLEQSKSILINATILALLITVVLGVVIARSITEPIKDVTVKAEMMAKGDFDQTVEVKSDDEIGQLANMFNYLTLKLKQTLSEVSTEKNKLDTIFTYMADGVIATGIEGNIIHANPVALNMLNISHKELTDLTYDDIFKELNDKLTLEYITSNHTWRGNEIIEVGSAIYNAKYAPLRNEQNVINGMILVLQDVTEQQKLENMRKEFVANVSHELKTPITTIKSYTETLIDGVLDNEDLSVQFLTVVNSECDRMARIVRDLLQLSNLDYNQTKWKRISIDVKELLEGIFMKVNMSAIEKKQCINLKVDENIGSINADKDGIEQVILNIVTNAIKYTQDNGKIDISAFRVKDKIVIKVKDNGIGIPEEDLGRIFERFYRVDKARSRALGGTGLGLSIAQQIIEAHDGHISINSSYNVGTEVDIVLPVE